MPTSVQSICSRKESWEIKKLGDCCNIQTGKLDANARVENGKYPFYTCDSQPYRIDTYAFDAEAILISGNGSLVGHVNYYKGKFNAYQRTYVLTEFSSFYIPYLIHFLKKYIRPYIMKNKKGGCIPYITLPILKNFLIPCPPLPEQENIVAELDCLSGVIEKQKQQLKELDNLAQAIFYDMFGDPITNEKGWEVKKLREVGEIVAGSTPSTSDPSNWDGDINWITPAEMGTQLYYGETVRKITAKAARGLTMMPIGTVLLSSRAPIGKLAISTVEMCCNQGFKNVVCGKGLNNIYLYYYLLLTMDSIQAMGRGATFKEVSKKAISDYGVVLPPLSLQQEFASKIEAIEKQKELIKQSLLETETLFNSRMDYYFN